MTVKRNARLTRELWSQVMAQYRALGRPLSDAELQSIVQSAPEPHRTAKCFAVPAGTQPANLLAGHRGAARVF